MCGSNINHEARQEARFVRGEIERLGVIENCVVAKDAPARG